jgi:hypothetical protein
MRISTAPTAIVETSVLPSGRVGREAELRIGDTNDETPGNREDHGHDDGATERIDLAVDREG